MSLFSGCEIDSSGGRIDPCKTRQYGRIGERYAHTGKPTCSGPSNSQPWKRVKFLVNQIVTGLTGNSKFSKFKKSPREPTQLPTLHREPLKYAWSGWIKRANQQPVIPLFIHKENGDENSTSDAHCHSCHGRLLQQLPGSPIQISLYLL